MRGFTLLELMIVIAVLGILAAVLIVNLQGVSREAKTSVAKSDLRTLKTALILYESHFNSLPPQSTWESSLQADRPRIIDRVPQDPFSQEGEKYIYKLNTDSPAGKTYVVLSVGENGKDDTLVFYDRVNKGEDDLIATNARVIE
ncbi:prepilin-type N-terminal cleavage/methylation domain-containing protein [Candidatus Calescamantes bacterium]|nr:prepilin-type N-terminal cleavage/methylation domain-containing protein [Candidatus Calescamantes bacterium]